MRCVGKTMARMGFPTHEQLASMGMNGAQFFDLCKWMIAGRKRFGDGWIRKVHPLIGFEVMDFIRKQELARRTELK